MATPDAFVPVAITRRSDFDESVHFGAVVGLAADGSIAYALGDPRVGIYPRSALKPLQALAMVRAGLRLPPDLLALVCASHDGTPDHVAGVRRILASAGLDETALGNTADLPINRPAAEAILRDGGTRQPVTMNCSGKHSGMLATCVHQGWPADARYLDVDHPLQQRIIATIDEIGLEPHLHIGVDGCGAPTHAMTLLALARSFATIASGRAGEEGDVVREAMISNPLMVGGPRRDVTLLMQHVPGSMAKDGADGVFAAAMPDGRAVALKIADGGDRARVPVMLAALEAIGIDTADAEPHIRQLILGHGRPVGDVRAVA